MTVAVLGKTRGNRGEVTAFPLSGKPERYSELGEVYLFAEGESGPGRRFEVEEAWFHAGRWCSSSAAWIRSPTPNAWRAPRCAFR